MSGNPAANYALGGDIDATATAAWNGGAGFAPIGGLAAYSTAGPYHQQPRHQCAEHK